MFGGKSVIRPDLLFVLLVSGFLVLNSTVFADMRENKRVELRESICYQFARYRLSYEELIELKEFKKYLKIENNKILKFIDDQSDLYLLEDIHNKESEKSVQDKCDQKIKKLAKNLDQLRTSKGIF